MLASLARAWIPAQALRELLGKGHSLVGMADASNESMTRMAVLVVLFSACSPFQPHPAGPANQTPAVTSVDGEVIGVDRVPPSDKLASGMRVTLRTEGSPVVVDLAPEWYLNQKGLEFGRADRMKVQGRAGPESVIYATQVETSGRSVVLRDASGRPVWGKPPQ